MAALLIGALLGGNSLPMMFQEETTCICLVHFTEPTFCGDLRAWGLKKEKLIRLFDGPIGDSHFMSEYHRYKEMRESLESKEALLKNFEAQCRDIFVDESHGRKIGLMKTLPL